MSNRRHSRFSNDISSPSRNSSSSRYYRQSPSDRSHHHYRHHTHQHSSSSSSSSSYKSYHQPTALRKEPTSEELQGLRNELSKYLPPFEDDIKFEKAYIPLTDEIRSMRANDSICDLALQERVEAAHAKLIHAEFRDNVCIQVLEALENTL